MAVLTPLINGVAYHWAQITTNIMGVPIAGITRVNYGYNQDISNEYGAGNQPVYRGYGNITPFCSLSLKMNEVINIMNAVPSGSLSDVPEFDVTVTYVDPGLRVPTVVHIVRNCRFTNNMVDANQNDMSLDIPLDLLPSHIDYNP